MSEIFNGASVRLRPRKRRGMLRETREADMRWMVVGLTLAIASCQTTEPRDPGPAPKDTKSIIREHVRTTFNDPYSLRDVEVGDPEASQIAGGWLVCFKANAKNRFGAYVGLTTIVFQIKNDRVIDDEKGESAERFCALRRMSPWTI
jgi:hypothetical protein